MTPFVVELLLASFIHKIARSCFRVSNGIVRIRKMGIYVS
jgi:hypothetical protein